MAAEYCFLTENEDVRREYGVCSGSLDQLRAIADYSSQYQTEKGFVFAVEDVDSMLDVILSRVAIFDVESLEMENTFICKHHFDSLGPHWEPQFGRGAKCQFISRHAGKAAESETTPDEETKEFTTKLKGAEKFKRIPKGDRYITKMQSEAVYHQEDILLPVGSTICRRCQEHCNNVFATHYKVGRLLVL